MANELSKTRFSQLCMAVSRFQPYIIRLLLYSSMVEALIPLLHMRLQRKMFSTSSPLPRHAQPLLNLKPPTAPTLTSEIVSPITSDTMGATVYDNEAQIPESGSRRQSMYDRMGSVSSSLTRLAVRTRYLLPSRTPMLLSSDFPYFFDLPAELREVIYEYYFMGSSVALPGQPCTGYGDAILQTSHQVRREALPIMFRMATLNVHLDRRFSKNHKHDLIHRYVTDNCKHVTKDALWNMARAAGWDIQPLGLQAGSHASESVSSPYMRHMC